MKREMVKRTEIKDSLANRIVIEEKRKFEKERLLALAAMKKGGMK